MRTPRFMAGIAITALALAACAPPAAAPLSAAPHESLDKKAATPKRLEAVIQINLSEMQFGSPQGEKNPTFRLPAGKTVGIHVHNEGAITHEIAIGRKVKTTAEGFEYEQTLTELVPMDLFFYNGATRSEVEGAEFGEMEVDAGIRDVWLRFTVPSELKGEWELGCFVKDHYEAGMKAKIVFE